MNYGRTSLGLRRIVATTAPGNCGSIYVLEKLGLRFERTFRLEGQEGETSLYALEG
jgi:ribosomal-protein-alanine N-acetyltransferase